MVVAKQVKAARVMLHVTTAANDPHARICLARLRVGVEEEWTPPGSRSCKRSGWVSRGRGSPLFFQCRAHSSSGISP